MSFQNQHAGAGAPGQSASSAGASAIIILALLALVIDAAILAAGSSGLNPTIPIPIIGGLVYRVNPLIPLAEGLILGWGLWRYAGLSFGRSIVAVIFLVALRIGAAAIGNTATGMLINMLPDALVTDPRAFILPVLLQTTFTSACILLVLAISAAAFRSIVVWIAVIVLWAGGAAFNYALFRDGTITQMTSLYLTPVVRALGFLAVGWAFTRRRSV